MGDAIPYGIDGTIRDWGDNAERLRTPEGQQMLLAEFRANFGEAILSGRELNHVFIAFSGGGPDGAFGAGLMNGWTALAGTSVSSMISGAGTSDSYKIFAIAQRDGVKFNLTYIPESFAEVPEEEFDVTYMRKLFELGYSYGLSGAHWSNYPPDYEPVEQGPTLYQPQSPR